MSAPQRNMPMENYGKHNQQLVETSIERAKEFYRSDSQLTQDDRRKLASYFWQKMTFYPLLGLPVMWGFIVAPNYLKRRNVLNPKKSYRLLQFGLGFMGLGAGFQLSAAVSSVVHLQLLKSNPSAHDAYGILRRYPPQLGARYFSMTASSPELAMKSPESIDWKNNPLFPIILVMNRDVIDRVKKAESGRYERFKTMQEENTQNEIKRRNNGGSEPQLTGSSWDSVIQRNKQGASSQDSADPYSADNSSQYTVGEPSRPDPPRSSWDQLGRNPAGSSVPPLQTSTLPPSINEPSGFGKPRSSWDWLSRKDQAGEATDDELNEKQQKFDAMIEQTRQESLNDDFSDQVVQDDFVDSEKKWG